MYDNAFFRVKTAAVLFQRSQVGDLARNPITLVSLVESSVWMFAGELLWSKLDQIKTQCLISWSSAMASGTAGVWFRKCLRLHDNEALVKAGSQFMGAVRRWQNLRSKLSKIAWIVWFGCAFVPVRVKWYSLHVESGFDTNHLFPLRYTQKASSLAEGGHWLAIVKLASDVSLSTRQPPLKVWCLSSSLIHTSKVL